MRGEHLNRVDGLGSRQGSSPRARGARLLLPVAGQDHGIIPACAGSTLFLPLAICCSRDHPRVRGEHPAFQALQAAAAGSSPRARGAQPTIPVLTTPMGIIPACAGSTGFPRSGAGKAGDHPRVRGEHTLGVSDSERPWGSSPRARGAPGRADQWRTVPGIIPACAGSTRGPHRHCRSRRDHPRVRGEHAFQDHLGKLGKGSSPRARGAQTPLTCGNTG